MFAKMTLEEFLNTLSSNSPTPGGGSVAALSGALAASLVSMVASLTVGKKGHEGYDSLMETTIETMALEQQRMKDLMDADAKAFDEVMASFKLPKSNDEEKKARKEKIQESLKKACMIPLETAEYVVKIAEFARDMVKYGNKNAVSDAKSALELCRACFNMACENVEINLSSIKDDEFLASTEKKVEELREALAVHLGEAE